MNRKDTMTSFSIKDCALAAIATGARSQNLKEFHDKLMTIHQGSVYHHFWGARLRPAFDDPLYNNDFAAWAKHGLHDAVLAERLSVIDPTDYEDIEGVRQGVIDVVEERLDESAIVPWAKSDHQFHFIRSQIVVFDTWKSIEQPHDLAASVARMSVGSIFYHFIDARRRDPVRMDDFQAWLSGFGDTYDSLCIDISAIDPYFRSLTELRTELSEVLGRYFS